MRFARASFPLALAAGLTASGCKFDGRASLVPKADPAQVRVRVLAVIYDPILESHEGKKLHEAMGWNDPDLLTEQLIADLNDASHGTVRYEIVERIERDEWPQHESGLRYTDEQYLTETAAGSWTLGDGDYLAIIASNQIESKVNGGEIDEVFLWGFPGAGWAESRMAGNGGYWVNSLPLGGVSTKGFILMGFNYERGVAEALESYGHRAESILRRVYDSWEAVESHDWNRFTLLDRDVPGRGGIGNAHNAFNAEEGTDYNRTSMRTVSTSADDWYNFPTVTGARTNLNCEAWGCDDRGYLKWWYDHMPHAAGTKDGILNNWWRYLVDPNLATSSFSASPEAELTDMNSADYACWAENSTCTLQDEATHLKRGLSSLRFETFGGFDNWIRYPAAGNANWDLSGEVNLSFWAYAINPSPFDFQNDSPWIYLKNADGSWFRYQSTGEPLNDAVDAWARYDVPLAGNVAWSRTTNGAPTLSDVDQVEIHADTWDNGFVLYLDDLGFTGDDPPAEQNPPTGSIVSPTDELTVAGTTPIRVDAADDVAVARVEVFLDGRLLDSDSIAPHVAFWDTTSAKDGEHRLSATVFDFAGNSAQTAEIVVTVENP